MKFQLPKVSFKNPLVITALVLLAVFVIYVARVAMMIVAMSKPRPPAVVTSVVAKQESWPRKLELVTQLQSKNGAMLKAEKAGTLREIAVVAGQAVKKGDLLLAIDADAERATAKLAKLTLERAQALRAQSVNTQNDLDMAEASCAEAMAALDKKEIRAPFDGVVGVPQVFIGQYVVVGSPLVAIEEKSVINADFGVPQRVVGSVAVGRPVQLTVDAYPEAVFEGKVEGIDPRLDDQTLTANARAVFDNKDGRLLSGMFGTLRVTLDGQDEGIALPATAIVYSAYGNSVYLISTDAKTQEKVARQSFVKILVTQGDWVLVSGIKAGGEVVTQGQMKLRNGASVRVDNTQALPVSKTPNVQEG